jgi:hypothetical protein
LESPVVSVRLEGSPTTWLVFSVLAPNSILRSRSIVVPFAWSSWVRNVNVSIAALSLAYSVSLSDDLARSTIPPSSATGRSGHLSEGDDGGRLRLLIPPAR